MGHRCGYILIPEGHPWHGMDYYDIQASVHGGLTYKQKDADGKMWLGFDCAHIGDAQDPSLPLSSDWKKTVYVILGPASLRVSGGTIRDNKYVQGQCETLIDQAIETLADLVDEFA